MTFGSLFSGFGGIDLGLEMSGMTCYWQVEINEYARRVLQKHWPHVPKENDVATFPRGKISSWQVDLIAGGFPCQPVSCAGRRQGRCDSRWLWPHFARIVRLLRPKYVVLENVPGLLIRGHGFEDVLGELAGMGFDAEWAVLPACAFGAVHPRERVFIVAYAALTRVRELSKGQGNKRKRKNLSCRSGEITSDADVLRCQGKYIGHGNEQPAQRGQSRSSEASSDSDSVDNEKRIFQSGDQFSSLPRACWGSDKPGVVRTSYGVPHRVERIRGLGNAVVPAVAKFVGEAILRFEQCKKLLYSSNGK